MNSVYNIIKDLTIYEEFKIIDANIVCESLNCKILQELASQLKNEKAENQKKIDKKYNDEKERWGSAYKESNYSKNFKNIFGGYGSVAWDKITDADITKIVYDDKVDKKLDKEVKNVIKNKSTKIILVRDIEDTKFEYLIYTWGEMYRLTNSGGYYGDYAGRKLGNNSGRKWKDLTQGEKLELCKNKVLYLIDKANVRQEAEDKRNKRADQKRGMIMLDPDSLRRIAQSNIERYKEILRKNRANNLNDDALLNEAKKIINQAASYAVMVAKDPVRHADLISLVSDLSVYIYDKIRYVNGTNPRNGGYYAGVNGLLPTIMEYTKNVKDIAQTGGYEHQADNVKRCQNDLKNAIKKANEFLKKIEDKIDE